MDAESEALMRALLNGRIKPGISCTILTRDLLREERNQCAELLTKLVASLPKAEDTTVELQTILDQHVTNIAEMRQHIDGLLSSLQSINRHIADLEEIIENHGK